eukprot:1349414-Rhodomonas_salina.1
MSTDLVHHNRILIHSLRKDRSARVCRHARGRAVQVLAQHADTRRGTLAGTRVHYADTRMQCADLCRLQSLSLRLPEPPAALDGKTLSFIVASSYGTGCVLRALLNLELGILEVALVGSTTT